MPRKHREPGTYRCACGERTPSEFAPTHFNSCRACDRTYRQEYILPALRGRGKDKVLPYWAEAMMKGRTLTLKAHTLRLVKHTNAEGETSLRPALKVSRG